MITLRRPTELELLRCTRNQSNDALSYQEVGETWGAMPANYFHNEHAVDLGRGEACFAAACGNLQQGRCLQLPWVSLFRDGPLFVGQDTAIVARVMRVWTLNCCRVVDVRSPTKTDGGHCFSFAVGTLGRHIMIGEERFTVAFDPNTEKVRFSIRSFSRASSIAAGIGTPVIRYYQRCFVDSVARAMQQDLQATATSG
tara:strand:- start:1033 stop:1626 length:594 start_codon:yes stop_codon:yes gene_type:complete